MSGLALGIDAAAHRGALSVNGAPPIGVVGTGLDIVYPAANRDLWDAVAARGLLLSESPLGSRAERWRFPARNRLLAAIADVVVVVESHEAGGSLHTVAEAAARDRPVMAVPGPIRSSASAGTNRLLSDGCAPVCSVDDVLVALGLSAGRRRPSADPAEGATTAQAVVLDALGWQPTTFEQLADRCAVALGELAATVAELCELGWIHRHGGWLERVEPRPHRPNGRVVSGAPQPRPRSVTDRSPWRGRAPIAWDGALVPRRVRRRLDVGRLVDPCRVPPRPRRLRDLGRAAGHHRSRWSATHHAASLSRLPRHAWLRPAHDRRGKAAALRRYFRWARRTGAITIDPAAHLSAPKGQARLPRVLRDRRARPRCSMPRSPPATIDRVEPKTMRCSSSSTAAAYG